MTRLHPWRGERSGLGSPSGSGLARVSPLASSMTVDEALNPRVVVGQHLIVHPVPSGAGVHLRISEGAGRHDQCESSRCQGRDPSRVGGSEPLASTVSRIWRLSRACSAWAVALADPLWRRDTSAVITARSVSSAPAGYRFPREVIAVGVRWYLRYGLSYRDVEEVLAERGITVDHVTEYRWVQTFTPEFIDAAHAARHATGGRWFVHETYVKVAGRWTYLYRAIDQRGQVIDVLVSQRRDGAAARAFFTRALIHGPSPVEVTTDRAPVYPRVIDELAPVARHAWTSTRLTRWKPITAG